MAGNSLGQVFRLTTFGESHGAAIGGIIDGCPAGLTLDFDAIQSELSRRRPGQSDITTPRQESDTAEWLSGVFEGKTTGTPIAFIIRNKDQHSADYNHLKDVFRPSHSDFTYEAKYGHRDHRGGGRSSARETAVRVAAGAVARQLLAHWNIQVRAYVSAIGDVEARPYITEADLSQPENDLRCPDLKAYTEMRRIVEAARDQGDTLGGVVSCVVRNAPVGLGEPVFDKLHADLGKAMLSINAVKGFEIGSGFRGSAMSGSAHNDVFTNTTGRIATETNHSGGIQGGISNGMNIEFRVAFKPVASIKKEQKTVSKSGEETELKIEGRHDPCVVPRAVPIVEAMCALVLADHLLRNKTSRI